jgi:hypothetical protein
MHGSLGIGHKDLLLGRKSHLKGGTIHFGICHPYFDKLLFVEVDLS